MGQGSRGDPDVQLRSTPAPRRPAAHGGPPEGPTHGRTACPCWDPASEPSAGRAVRPPPRTERFAELTDPAESPLAEMGGHRLGQPTPESSGLSISAARIAAISASPRSPRAAPWSMARTVSSRIPVRDDRSCISSTQAAGPRVAVADAQLAQRVEDVDVEPDVGVGQAGGPGPRVEQPRERPVDVAGRLGHQGQPTGRDALPAGVPDLAGPGKGLLEALGRSRQVALGDTPGRGAPAARAGTTASGRRSASVHAARELHRSASSRSPRSRPIRPSMDSP